MSLRQSSSLLLLACLTLPACWFSSSGPVVEPSRPPSIDRESQTAEEGVETEAVSQDPGWDRTAIPLSSHLESHEFEAARPFVSLTKKGLTVALVATTNKVDDRAVHFELSIPHGSPFGDRNSIAWLTARVIADAPRSHENKPSLRAAIEALGGELTLEVDGAVTRFLVATDQSNWETAFSEMLNAIGTTPSRRQTRVAQVLAMMELSDTLATAPEDGTLRRVTCSSDFTSFLPDPLQDLNQTNVAAFRNSAYQPAGAVLTIHAWGNRSKMAMRAKKLLQPWLRDFPDAIVTPTPPLNRPDGILWATGRTADCEASILIDVPPTTGPQNAAYLVLLECLIGTGSSGRLPRQLRSTVDPGLQYEIERIDNGPYQFLVLRTRCLPSQVDQILAATNAAIGALASGGPTPPEARLAAARVRLRLLTTLDTPKDALRATTSSLLAVPTLPPDGYRGTLEALQSPDTLDFTAAGQLLSVRPPAIVVSGGNPPADVAKRVADLGELPNVAEIGVPKAPPEQKRLAAQVFLKTAVAAIGGESRLLDVDGFAAKTVVHTGRGPQSYEMVGFDQKNRRLRRVRIVLATTIDTNVKDTVGTEQVVGEKPIDLDEDEVTLLFSRVERHPLFLLSSVARGESSYKLVSSRRIGGRQFAMLELEDADRPLLRILVDIESGLIRSVHTLEHLPGVGTVSITEQYRDYRNISGVRVPHHKTTLIDDTTAGSVTMYTEFRPTTPPPLGFDPNLLK